MAVLQREKVLLALPISAPPNVVITPSNKINKWGNVYTRENYMYSAEIVDENVLMLTVFNNEGVAKYRTFTKDYSYVSQFFVNGNSKKSTTKLGNAYGEWYNDYSNYITDTNNAKIIVGWLKSYKNKDENIFAAVARYQQDIGKQKIKAMHDRIRKTVDDMMLQIKPLPKDFDKWINNIPFKDNRYILYDYAKRKQLDGYCTHCETFVKVTGAKNKAVGICPNCKTKITYLASGVTANKFCIDVDVSYIQQGSSGELIFRFFQVSRTFYRESKKLLYSTYIQEQARQFYNSNKTYRWDNFRATGEYRFCETYQRYIETSTYIYTSNLKKIFKKDIFAYTPNTKHLQYMPFADIGKMCGKLNPVRLYTNTIRYPVIEYLVKLKLYKMTYDVVRYHHDINEINLNGKNIIEVLGITKQDLPYLQKNDIGLWELDVYKTAKSKGVKALDEIIAFARKYSCKAANDIVNIAEYTTIYKAIKYANAQVDIAFQCKKYSWSRTDIFDIINDWRDYIKACKTLKYDLKNDFVLMPNNLKNAHDKTNELLESKANAKYNRAIAKLSSKLNEQYGFKTKNLLIRAPKNANEITAEGQKLRHCVGRNDQDYIKDMANRETIILFVRQISKPDKPFYTVEITDNKIRQVRGYDNEGKTPEVEKFMKQFETKILNKNKRSVA